MFFKDIRYICRRCNSRCKLNPYADIDGNFVFYCTNPDCNHYFYKSMKQLFFDDDSMVC